MGRRHTKYGGTFLTVTVYRCEKCRMICELCYDLSGVLAHYPESQAVYPAKWRTP